jgi:hypothetical protein
VEVRRVLKLEKLYYFTPHFNKLPAELIDVQDAMTMPMVSRRLHHKK